MMTKKDFISLANALRKTMPKESEKKYAQQWMADVDQIAKVCAASNPDFDREKFEDYITRIQHDQPT